MSSFDMKALFGEKAIAELTRDQQVLFLRWHGFTYKEISRRLKIKPTECFMALKKLDLSESHVGMLRERMNKLKEDEKKQRNKNRRRQMKNLLKEKDGRERSSLLTPGKGPTGRRKYSRRESTAKIPNKRSVMPSVNSQPASGSSVSGGSADSGFADDLAQIFREQRGAASRSSALNTSLREYAAMKPVEFDEAANLSVVNDWLQDIGDDHIFPDPLLAATSSDEILDDLKDILFGQH